MSKEVYLSQLRMKLKSLPKDEIEAAMYYVSEYFLEAGEGNDSKVIAELGAPERFAAQIKAEHALKTMENQPEQQSTKKSVRNMALLILGIVSLPFSLPVVIALLIALFVISILFFVVGFVFVVLIGAGGVAGISMLASGISSLFTNSPVGLVTTGTALLLLGSVMLIILLSYALFAKLMPYLVKGLGKLFRKAKGEENYEN